MGFSLRRFLPKHEFVSASPAPTAAPTQEELALSKQSWPVRVPADGRLYVTARHGDTFWSLARGFAATRNPSGVPTASEVLAYVRDLQAVNGSPLFKGQEVEIPLNKRASAKLSAVIAVQRDYNARIASGESLPLLDWATAVVTCSAADAIKVTVQPLRSDRPEVFAARHMGAAWPDGDVYQVATITPPVPIHAVHRRTEVPANGYLAIRVQPGETMWAIARRFAAAHKEPGAPTAAETTHYIRDIQRVNGYELRAGQTLKLPLSPNAHASLHPLIAAQQDWERRGDLGFDTADLDWSAASAIPDATGAVAVEVPDFERAQYERLSVRKLGATQTEATVFEVAFQKDLKAHSGALTLQTT